MRRPKLRKLGSLVDKINQFNTGELFNDARRNSRTQQGKLLLESSIPSRSAQMSQILVNEIKRWDLSFELADRSMKQCPDRVLVAPNH